MKPEEKAFLLACKKSNVNVRHATKEEQKKGLYLLDNDNKVYVVTKDKCAKLQSTQTKKNYIVLAPPGLSVSAARSVSVTPNSPRQIQPAAIFRNQYRSLSRKRNRLHNKVLKRYD